MSYCEYFQGDGDGDYNEFTNCTSPVARKEHKCHSCGLPIPKGTKYEKMVGKYDGALFTIKQHVECEKILKLGMIICKGDIVNYDASTHVVANGIVKDHNKELTADEKRVISLYSELLEKYDPAQVVPILKES